MKTPGGEVQFIATMVQQARPYRNRVLVFTTLLGHKSSLAAVKQLLKSEGAASLSTTEFCQGRTMRWGVAWTFQQNINLTSVLGTKAQKELAKPFSWSLPCGGGEGNSGSSSINALTFFQEIKRWLAEIKVRF